MIADRLEAGSLLKFKEFKIYFVLVRLLEKVRFLCYNCTTNALESFPLGWLQPSSTKLSMPSPVSEPLLQAPYDIRETSSQAIRSWHPST